MNTQNTLERLVRRIAGLPLRSWGTGLLFSVVAGGLILTGCESTSGPISDLASGRTGEGSVRMHMVDAPANVEAVVVAVSEVQVHTSGSGDAEGWVTVSDGPAMYDLLSLRNGSTALIAESKLQAGLYTQIRLILGTGSYAVVAGAPVGLEVASGFETGIKLNHQFMIQANQTYELTLDFDVEQSLIPSGIDFMLHPVIRIIANATSGSVSGHVMPASASARVQVMSGSDTVSTTVCDDSTGFFKFSTIPEGTYDLSIRALAGLFMDTVITQIGVVRDQETVVDTVFMTATLRP